MTAIVLYRIGHAKHMHRYYRMDVQPDLFGQWRLMREWGRIGSTSQTRSAPFRTPHEAHAALDKPCQAKKRRGYSLCFNIELANAVGTIEVSGL